jgi:hypothetical protein
MTVRSTAFALGVMMMSIPAFLEPANALSLQECSVKYKAAQTAGTLKGMKWSDFRKAECGADATPASSTAPATTAPKQEKKEATRPAPTPSAAPSARAAPGNAVFPAGVSPKYAKESEGKARMHTCLDQYNANKANNGNAGMKWIEKGGGYYSECNRRLKG